jgi:hypothetical protein
MAKGLSSKEKELVGKLEYELNKFSGGKVQEIGPHPTRPDTIGWRINNVPCWGSLSYMKYENAYGRLGQMAAQSVASCFRVPLEQIASQAFDETKQAAEDNVKKLKKDGAYELAGMDEKLPSESDLKKQIEEAVKE